MATVRDPSGLGTIQSMQKRMFDIVFSIIGLLMSGWLIILAWLVASIDSRGNGFFVQHRIGQNGRIFKIVKIKTMRQSNDVTTTITQSNDPRITHLGHFLRQLKLDELPQFWNVLVGDMSFVGPRPDVPGYADLLQGRDRIILSVRPGLTGPASLKYRDEERLLAEQIDPQSYNDNVLWPDKVRLNREYVEQWSFIKDLGYIIKTISG